MPEHPTEIEVIRKRLGWRASRRGIKEMDIVVGGFAEKYLPGMTLEELQRFSEILEIPDQDLLSWVTGVSQVPLQHDDALLRRVLSFRPLEGMPE